MKYMGEVDADARQVIENLSRIVMRLTKQLERSVEVTVDLNTRVQILEARLNQSGIPRL